jgi:hypothetical protein
MQTVAESTQVIYGQGGLRAPLPRYIQPDGVWGYIIGAAHPGNGHSHTFCNFHGFPKSMEARETSEDLSDMRYLMEAHHRANYADLRLQGEKGYKDWKRLWGKNEGEIMVLASCGPSLTASLPLLYRHRDKFRLMTLNRSHRAFQGREVAPDYHYFVERRALPDWCHEVENVTNRVVGNLCMDGVTLIGTPQCDPRMVNLFSPKNRYWGWSSLGSLGQHAECKDLTSFDVKAGTTIGNAPYIAWKLGFRKIVLVGCDFALDCRLVVDNNSRVVEPRRMYFDRMWYHTHYAGKAPDGHKHFLSRHIPAVGIDGHPCSVDARMIGWRDYFMAVLDITQYEAGVECVNATPRGILNWNVRALEEALEL